MKGQILLARPSATSRALAMVRIRLESFLLAHLDSLVCVILCMLFHFSNGKTYLPHLCWIMQALLAVFGKLYFRDLAYRWLKLEFNRDVFSLFTFFNIYYEVIEAGFSICFF